MADHSPDLAALGAGVEVARGLLLWQLLHRALHTHLLRDGLGYMAFNATRPPQAAGPFPSVFSLSSASPSWPPPERLTI